MIIQILNTYDNYLSMTNIRNKILGMIERYGSNSLFLYNKYLLSYSKLKIDSSYNSDIEIIDNHIVIFSELPILDRIKDNNINIDKKVVIEFCAEFLKGCEHYIPVKFITMSGVTSYKVYNSKFETLEIDDLLNIINREIAFYILNE